MTARVASVSTWPLGRIGLAAYLAVLVTYVIRVGIPTDRIGQTAWILAGIAAAKLGRPWREHVRALVDWLPLLAALMLYDHTRGIADTLGMPVRVGELVDAELAIFGGALPTVWMQERFYTPGDPQWWDVVASVVYFSHFVLPWALAAVLYVLSRALWWGYVRKVLLLSYAGLLTYVLVPAAPPWYAAQVGLIAEDVDRNIGAGWSVIGLRFAGAWLERAQAGSNLVAALPSLHAAFALLVSVALWPLVRSRWIRAVLVAFPVAMGATLVYSGEHYVVDVLLGWVYVAAVVAALRLWDRLRTGRSASAHAAEDVAGRHRVLRPDEQPVAPAATGDGAANGRRGERLPETVDFHAAGGVGDRLEEAVVRPALDDGGPAAERPARKQQ